MKNKNKFDKLYLYLIISLTYYSVFCMGEESRIKSLNNYSVLSTYNSVEELKAELHPIVLEVSNDFGLIEDYNSPLGKLSRLIKLLKTFRLEEKPKGVPSGISEALIDPLQFLKKHIPLIKYSSTTTEYAYMYNPDRSIVLGSGFFNAEPLEAIAVLLHEANHEISNHSDHSQCLRGEFALIFGGCDNKVDGGEKIGSYSFAMLYQVAMARFNKSLSLDDRKFLLKRAHNTLSHSFLNLPRSKSIIPEIIYVRTRDNKLYLMHPFIKGKYVLLQDNVFKIKPAGGNRGVYVRDTNFHYSLYIRPWDEIQEKSRLIKSLEGKELFDFDRAHDGDNSFEYLIRQNKNGTRSITKLIYGSPRREVKDDFEIPEGVLPKKVIGDYYGFVFLLSESGKLYQADFQNRKFIESLYYPNNSLSHWRDIWLSPSKFGFEILDSTGTFYNIVNGVLLKSLSQSQVGRALSYSEGRTMKVILSIKDNAELNSKISTEEPEQFLEIKLNQNAQKMIKIPIKELQSPIEEIVVVSLAHFNEDVLPFEKSSEKFNQDCNIIQSIKDPWMERGLGISKNGEWIAEGDDTNSCIKLDFSKVPDSYLNVPLTVFTTTQTNENENDAPYMFPKGFESSPYVLKPYEVWGR